jgi:hypothetical protein
LCRRGVGADDGVVRELLRVTVGNRREPEAVRSIAREQDGIVARAQLRAAGEGALLSHGTAARRWRIIPAPPSVMQLAVPQPRTAPAGVTLHQSGRLRPGDAVLNGRFRSTTPARTLLGLATRYDHRDAFAQADALGDAS